MIRRFVYQGKERWQVSFWSKRLSMRVIFDAFDSYEEAVKASKIVKLQQYDNVLDINEYFLIKELL